MVWKKKLYFFLFCSYFGRKRLVKKNENWVEGSDRLVHASYSYWTLGYVLSLNGAKKLLGMTCLDFKIRSKKRRRFKK